ncbi:MAG: GntR family transcriptional regulator [Anaerolineales bacterium]|nr:GntR family transcriptional regulator [Anaerolineales bacterium]
MIDGLQALKTYQTKEEYVYNVLRAAILNCELEPGERLVIDRLSEQFGISPIPVRTVLHRLQSEGLVEITPHSVANVSHVSLEMVEEVFALLEALERIAFNIAVDKVSDENLELLNDLMAAMDRCVEKDDYRQWSRLNSEFHCAIAAMTEMGLLLEFTKRTMDRWIRLSCCFDQIDPRGIYQSQNEHREMMELLVAGDREGLIDLLIQHNRVSHDSYRSIIMDGIFQSDKAG